jgi:PAS domain S-box-containing protein
VGSTALLAILLPICLIVLVLLLLVLYLRFDRQRATTAASLKEIGGELRVLSQVAEHTENAVMITDERGRLTWVNAAFVALTGWTLAEVLGHTPGSLLQGSGTDRPLVDSMRQALREERGFLVEVTNYHRGGRELRLSLNVEPIRDDAGRLTNFIAVAVDVTSRFETEENLRAAKRAADETAAEKVAFLATMSHEMRTPLNAILGLANLLETTGLTSTQGEYVSGLLIGGRALLAQVNNMLTYSALESGRTQLVGLPVDLRALLRRCTARFEPQATARGLELGCTLDPRVPDLVVTDEQRLEQVMTNLLDNAIKFTRSGSVQAQLRLGPEPVSGALVPIVLSVVDTGIGIPERRLASLFQPFQRGASAATKAHSGAALGLATSSALARHLGGQLEVASIEGEGSTFTVRLAVPVAGGLPNRPTDGPSGSADFNDTKDKDTDLSGLRVLVVEDDPVNQRVAVELLGQLGISPALANDGVEALELLQHQPFDVLFLDINMPRLDGVSTAGQIRRRQDLNPQPALIALTANALPGDQQRFQAAGMSDYLTKPVTQEDIARALHRYLRSAKLPGSSLVSGSGPDATSSAVAMTAPVSASWPVASPTAKPYAPRPRNRPPINLDGLQSTLGDLSDAFIQEIVTLFVTQSEERLSTFRTQLAAGDRVGLKSTAHAIQGSAANVHAGEVRRLAAGVEDRMGRPGEQIDAGTADRLEAAVARVQAWLSARYDQPAPPPLPAQPPQPPQPAEPAEPAADPDPESSAPPMTRR